MGYSQGNNKNTWLYIRFSSPITDLLGEEIPYPQKHYINTNNKGHTSFTYGWLLDGFFHTKNNANFLNDIISRIILTTKDFTSIETVSNHIETNSKYNPIKLKQFQGLKSLVEKRKDYTRADSTVDYTFWTLKYLAEDLIKEDGFIIYQKLEDYAHTHFADHKKGYSTVRAKCRSIYYWYEKRDWEIGRVNKMFNTKEELKEFRSKMYKDINERTKENNSKKIENIINGLFAKDYKKKNGKWNISKVAKDTGLHRNTVMKYL